MPNITGADQIPQLGNVESMFFGVAIIIGLAMIVFIFFTIYNALN